MKSLVSKITGTPKAMLFFDGIGALLSASAMAIVTFVFQEKFGIPFSALYVLLGFAICFTIYSLFYSIKNNGNYAARLKFIMKANIFYFSLSFFFMIFYSNQITTLGFAFLITEIFIIIGVVILEQKTLQKSTKNLN